MRRGMRYRWAFKAKFNNAASSCPGPIRVQDGSRFLLQETPIVSPRASLSQGSIYLEAEKFGRSSCAGAIGAQRPKSVPSGSPRETPRS
jgi:hypothetical protein